MQAATTYLKFIPFENLNLWDVKRYYTQTNLHFEKVVTLRDILIPYKKAVSKEEMIENKWQIISKINFSGELFLRDFEEIKTYKGNVNLVPENAIIYSKINVRHGCIYFHEKGQMPFGVSSEYPPFKFDETKINGKFLHKVLRSSAFKNLLNSKTTGISKARVKQDEFLDIQIPLPSLSEQEAIVANYYAKIREAEELERQAEDLEREIKTYLFAVLGIKIESDINKHSELRIIQYEDLERWDGKKENEFNSKFKIEKIGKYITTIFTGTTPPTNRKEYFENGNINFFTPSDIGFSMYLTNAERKLTILAIKDKKARVFKEGTLLFVGIGSTVGKIGIVANEYATSNQQITGFTINNEFLLNEYTYLYFDYFRDITTKKQTKSTLPILNQDKILNIPIPIPPIAKQKEIASRVQMLKEKIKYIKDKVMMLKNSARDEFENAIFKL